jgi:hypothetical protein
METVEEEEEILCEDSGVVGKVGEATDSQAVYTFGRGEAHEEREMENFYYQCIYDILQDPEKRRRMMADVNKLKAKIVQLHSARMEAVKLDVEDRVTYKDGKASIYHIIKQKSRREQRTVTRILDKTDRQ